MIRDYKKPIMTGRNIVSCAERCISYRTPSSEFIKANLDKIRGLGPEVDYEVPYSLNSTKEWRHFVEEFLPEYVAKERMRDLC